VRDNKEQTKYGSLGFDQEHYRAERETLQQQLMLAFVLAIE